MASKGDFVQQALAQHGVKIKDAEIFETLKGETTTTVIGVSTLGKTTKTVVVS